MWWHCTRLKLTKINDAAVGKRTQFIETMDRLLLTALVHQVVILHPHTYLVMYVVRI